MTGIVVITGASRGIGAATALRAGEAGYDVCVNYNQSKERAEGIAAAVRAVGCRAICVQADTRIEADVMRLFETVDQELGVVRALVNNAGGLGRPSVVADLSADEVNAMFTANATSYFVCAREAIRRMSTATGGQGGAIVNVGSVAARIGSPGLYVHYAAAKAAVDTFTIGLAKEVADQGIRVNAVRPGMIHSDIRVSAGLPDGVEEIAPTIPMKRYGDAEEVADSILWLLSNRSSYVTATLVDVSGGR